jgi:archaellum component FlaF (FlaF/FlaG flagellin family)
MYLTQEANPGNNMSDIVKLSQDKFIRIVSDKIESTEKMKLLWRCTFIVLIFCMSEWLIIRTVQDNSMIISVISLLVALKFVYLNYENYNSAILYRNNRIAKHLSQLENLFSNDYQYTAQDNNGTVNTVLKGQIHNIDIRYISSEHTVSIQYPAFTVSLTHMIGYNISKKEFNSIIEKKF